MTTERREQKTEPKLLRHFLTLLRFFQRLFTPPVTSHYPHRRQRHLTLAQIAAGMVVAGLLSASALQAQALVENRQLRQTTAQVKAFTAALVTFTDIYGALPGDFSGAGAKLKKCAGVDCNPWPEGADNKDIGPARTKHLHSFDVPETTHVPAQSAEDETILFWQHLSRADLISGVTDAGLQDKVTPAFGTTHPAAKMEGAGFIINTMKGATFPAYNPRQGEDTSLDGLVITLTGTALLHNEGTLVSDGVHPLTPREAAQIDRKLDDGKPYNGLIKAYGGETCLYKHEKESILANWFRRLMGDDLLPERHDLYDRLPDGGYNEASTVKDCGLFFVLTP